MKKNTRNDFIAFRVNSKDKALLQELADNEEISLSALARKKVKELLKKKVKDVKVKDVKVKDVIVRYTYEQIKELLIKNKAKRER